MATGEALLAVALSVWYSEVTLPALQSCTPQSFFTQPPHTCECSVGFINPPSLLRTVYRFNGVSNCSEFGMWVRTIHRVLHALYSTGVVLSLVGIIMACKKLHSAGFCGKSGIYLVSLSGLMWPHPQALRPRLSVPDFAPQLQSCETISGMKEFGDEAPRYDAHVWRFSPKL